MSIKKYIEQIKKIDEKTHIIDETVEFWANQIEDELKKCDETEADPDHPDFTKKMLSHRKNEYASISWFAFKKKWKDSFWRKY